jgi:CPA2 family monovalent cation:H+ antiporter-2
LSNSGLYTGYPLLVRLAPTVGAGARLLRPLDRLLGVHGIDEAAELEQHPFSDHVIVVGYGTSGRAICAALAELGLHHVVLELNVDTVRDESARGIHIYYGDASSTEALAHAGLARARALILFIDDEHAAVRAIQAARAGAPRVLIVARTRYALHRGMLLAAGADDVIVEQLESGLEMMAVVLARFGVARDVIDAHVDRARDQTVGRAGERDR